MNSVVPDGPGSGSRWNSPDDQIDYTEVEDLLVRVVVGDLFLFLLDLPHQLFGLVVREERRKMHRKEGQKRETETERGRRMSMKLILLFPS